MKKEKKEKSLHVGNLSDLLGDHPELFKVDESVHLRVVAEMQECQVLFHDREERNHRRMNQFRVDQVPVLGHVSRGVHHLESEGERAG